MLQLENSMSIPDRELTWSNLEMKSVHQLRNEFVYNHFLINKFIL